MRKVVCVYGVDFRSKYKPGFRRSAHTVSDDASADQRYFPIRARIEHIFELGNRYNLEALKLAHKCDACTLTLPTQRGLNIHAARWCDGEVTQRSRRGSLADRAVQTATLRSRMSTHSSIWG